MGSFKGSRWAESRRPPGVVKVCSQRVFRQVLQGLRPQTSTTIFLKNVKQRLSSNQEALKSYRFEKFKSRNH